MFFSDGAVKVKSGAGWKPVETGDSLSSASVVKLASGSMLEIVSSKSTLMLYDAGIYALNDFLKKLQNVKSQKFLNAVNARIQNMVQGNNYHNTSAAGLRGLSDAQRTAVSGKFCL